SPAEPDRMEDLEDPPGKAPQGHRDYLSVLDPRPEDLRRRHPDAAGGPALPHGTCPLLRRDTGPRTASPCAALRALDLSGDQRHRVDPRLGAPSQLPAGRPRPLRPVGEQD